MVKHAGGFDGGCKAPARGAAATHTRNAHLMLCTRSAGPGGFEAAARSLIDQGEEAALIHATRLASFSALEAPQRAPSRPKDALESYGSFAVAREEKGAVAIWSGDLCGMKSLWCSRLPPRILWRWL